MLDDKCGAGEWTCCSTWAIRTPRWGFLDRACMIMDLYDDPMTTAASKKMIAEAEEELGAPTATSGHARHAPVLAQSSHLMLWSDNDVANDYGGDQKGSDEQKYSDQFIKSAMGVYTEYQRQLWDLVRGPAAQGRRVGDGGTSTYRGLGVFMVDMRGMDHRGWRDGEGRHHERQAEEGARGGLPDARAELHAGGERDSVRVESPAMVQESAKFVKFLEGHWAYKEDECTWLYDLCFDWKAARRGARWCCWEATSIRG